MKASADGPTPDKQSKAQCLCNFAKYVEWPTNTFATETNPICIGVIGNDDFAQNLQTIGKGRSVRGHPISVQTLRADQDAHKCQIVFVGSSANNRLKEILRPLQNKPILTVGEGNLFSQAGGIICFVIRDDKVKFDIDVAAASRARLQISSKLLSLADAVRGKSP